MPKRISVGNLPVEAETGDLEQFCSKHGDVTNVEIKGSQARITMSSGLESAAKALDGHVVHGSTLSVTIHHAEQDWLI